MADLPSRMLQNGMTVSFWLRDMTVGSTILSLQDTLSLLYKESGEMTQTFELRAGVSKEEIHVYSPPISNQWYWLSLAIQVGKSVSVSIYSSGMLDGTASVDLESCSVDSESDVALQLFPPHGDIERVLPTDVSFILVHQALVEDPKEVVELGRQAKRYDKSS